jgi:hypothetical protein
LTNIHVLHTVDLIYSKIIHFVINLKDPTQVIYMIRNIQLFHFINIYLDTTFIEAWLNVFGILISHFFEICIDLQNNQNIASLITHHPSGKELSFS